MKHEVTGAALALSRALGAPIYNHSIKKDVGLGELDYERYLKTQTLLSLQTRPDELVVPDELLFQVLHQAQELWLKSLAFECVPLIDALDGDDLVAAIDSLERIGTIARCLETEIRVLYTLAPQTFQIIRRQLGNGSGLESPGYNQILLASEAAGAAFQRLYLRRGATLLRVYSNPRAEPLLHHIAERFVDWDDAFQSWLFAHFMLVRRTIGVDRRVKALDGYPTSALATRMVKPLFPELWEVRVELTQGWDRGAGFAPGAPRTQAGKVTGTHPIPRGVPDDEKSSRGA